MKKKNRTILRNKNESWKEKKKGEGKKNDVFGILRWFGNLVMSTLWNVIFC